MSRVSNLRRSSNFLIRPQAKKFDLLADTIKSKPHTNIIINIRFNETYRSRLPEPPEVCILADTHTVDQGYEQGDKSKHKNHDPNIPKQQNFKKKLIID